MPTETKPTSVLDRLVDAAPLSTAEEIQRGAENVVATAYRQVADVADVAGRVLGPKEKADPLQKATALQQLLDEDSRRIAVLDGIDPTGKKHLETRAGIAGRFAASLRDAADLIETDRLAGRGGYAAETIASGIGSTLPVLAAGAVGAAGATAVGLSATLGQVAAGGTMGALTSGSAKYLEAKMRGASDEDAAKAGIAAGIFGISEVLPLVGNQAKLTGILARVNQRSGGLLNRVMFSPTVQGLEEGGQEGLGRVVSNVIDRFILDDDRALLREVWSEAEAGLWTGIIMRAALGGGTLRTEEGQPAQEPGPVAEPVALRNVAQQGAQQAGLAGAPEPQPGALQEIEASEIGEGEALGPAARPDVGPREGAEALGPPPAEGEADPVEAFLSGQDLPLEALTPQLISEVVRRQTTPEAPTTAPETPGAQESAPGASQPETARQVATEPVQAPLGTGGAPGTSTQAGTEESQPTSDPGREAAVSAARTVSFGKPATYRGRREVIVRSPDPGAPDDPTADRKLTVEQAAKGLKTYQVVRSEFVGGRGEKSREVLASGLTFVAAKKRASEIIRDDAQWPANVPELPESSAPSVPETAATGEPQPAAAPTTEAPHITEEGRPRAQQEEAQLAKPIEEKVPDELMAFPGSVLPEVKRALDAVAKKLGFRRQQQAVQAGVIPTENLTNRLLRRWQDTFRAPKKVVEAVVKSGGEITDATDFYLQEELRRKRTVNRLERLKQHRSQIAAGLREDRISVEEAGSVLMARAAPDRNRIIRERDPKNDDGSGFTDAEANAILAEALAGKRSDGFRRLFERFDALVKETRQGWVKDGIKTQAEVDALAKAQPFYAPMRSDLDELDPQPARGTGQGVDVRAKPFRAATGRHTKADASNVLAYMFTQAEQSAIAGEKTKVIRSFANLIRANADIFKGVVKIDPAETKPTLVNGMVRQTFDPRYRMADNVVGFWEDGKLHLMEIDKRYQPIASALKNLNAQDLHSVLNLSRSINSWVRAVVVTYNPVFGPVNALRDAAGAFINSQEHGLAFSLRTVRDVPLAWRALYRNQGESRPVKPNKWDDYARRFAEVGGPVGYIDLDGFNGHIERIERDLKAEASGSWATATRNFLGAMRAGNEILEHGTRLSAFVRAIEDLGMTDERAASWAKNLTVNFERKGEYGAVLNSLFLFANAAIQSVARVGQAVRHPGVLRLLASAFVGLMGWDQVMRAIAGKDVDGEDCWDKIPSYIKRHNFIFMFAAEEGCGRMVTIPAPFTYDFIQTLAFQLSGAMSGDVKPGEATLEIMSAFVEAFDPIGSGELDLSDPASIARTLSPTALDPVVELATNRDWRGAPIQPTNEFDRTKPDSETYWPDASSVSIGVSRWLNRAAGGDEFSRGSGAIGKLLDLSPETLDHWGHFVTGGVGRTLAQLYETKTSIESGQRVHPRDVPLLSRFLREPSPYASSKTFREIRDQLIVDNKRAKRDKERNPHYNLYKAANAMEERRAKRQKEIEQLQGDAREAAERDLDREIQKFNGHARREILTQ